MLGTVVLDAPEVVATLLQRFGPERVVVTVDAKDGLVAVRGWREVTDVVATELAERMAAMSRGRKIVLIVFIIWLVQAIPKWTAAIMADGETSAAIMTFFITPR